MIDYRKRFAKLTREESVTAYLALLDAHTAAVKAHSYESTDCLPLAINKQIRAVLEKHRYDLELVVNKLAPFGS